jgi:hypothetical protein
VISGKFQGVSQRGDDVLAYVSYDGEISDEDGQHAIYVRPILAGLPDDLTRKVAHGGGGNKISTVANKHHWVL